MIALKPGCRHEDCVAVQKVFTVSVYIGEMRV